MNKKEALRKLKEEVEKCTKCPLHQHRTHIVFGEGNPDTRLLFVGEAPGFYEDKIGRPFVGQAGKLLDRLLQQIGLKREEIYIANVIKCRPPQNRDPFPEEIELCKPYLMKQIKIINPPLICTLGRFALQVISGRKLSITKVHGTLIKKGGFLLYPLFHPAAALHRGNLYASLKKDFIQLQEILERLPSFSSSLPLFDL